MIETERFEIVPLTARHLKMWINDIGTLEKELNCHYNAEPVEGFFCDIIRGQLAKAESDSENYLYHTFWFIIRKTDRIAVGSCGFKHVPNENREVEIGYGLAKDFEGMGYMTEVIKKFCKWALALETIEHVIAETENGNPKSENVLKRTGFTMYSQNETNWWRL